VGEIIKTADEQLKVINISAGLSESLKDINSKIGERTEQMKTQSIPMISVSIRYMNELITNLVNTKKNIVFSDQQMMMEVFKGLKQK
jgi:hypothetical protein